MTRMNHTRHVMKSLYKAFIGFIAWLSGLTAWVHNGSGAFSVAAATAVVGYDLAQQTVWQQISSPRGLTGFALKGSAAANDTKVDLFVDTVKVAEFFNGSTGFPNMDDLIPIDAYVPPGGQIHVYVTKAPGTNPINGLITWDDL